MGAWGEGVGWGGGVFFLCGGRGGRGMVPFAHDAQCVMCVIFDVIDSDIFLSCGVFYPREWIFPLHLGI